MKRFLTLIMISMLFLSLVVVGCTNVQQPKPPQGPMMSENGQPPEAEATRQDVLGGDKKVVMGFYTDGEGPVPGSKDSMIKHVGAIDEVAFFWYTFDGSGKVTPTGKLDMTAKDAAQKNKAKAYALVHNMAGGGFDANLSP